MLGIIYTNPLMLAGMAALAVPVLIHLLLKRKKRRLRFSTIQFFAKQDEQSSQKRKLRNLLLLSIRMLIVALLVLAFARPFLPQGSASPVPLQKRQAVFVLDRSASMLATGSDGQRWPRAKEQVQKVIDSLGPDDRAALVGCANHSEVLSGFAPPVSVGKILANLQPAYGTSSLSEGLQRAVKLISSGDNTALSKTTIYVVSDLQRSACQNLASCAVPQDLEIKVISSGDIFSPNLGIEELQVDTRDDSGPHLSVASFSEEDSPDVALEISIDGKFAISTRFGLKSGASTNAPLVLPTLKPGWHDVKATLQAKDSFGLDDTRYAAVFAPEPMHVLVVESRKMKRAFQQESFFLTAALDPVSESTNSIQPAFTIVQIAPEELVAKCSNPRGQQPFDMIALPGLKELPAGAGKALSDFVQAGGGLLLFMGDDLSANRYNTELGGLLPAQLGKMEASPDPTAGWRLGEYETNTVIFAAFRLPNSGDLGIPQFSKRYGVTGGPDVCRLAFFDDGAPFLLGRSLGRGRVVLVNSSPDTSWNDWPKHKTFVPWLHGLGKYLAQNAPDNKTLQTQSFLAGNDFDIEMGSGAKGSQFKIRSAGHQEVVLTADDQGRLRDPGWVIPGIYSIFDKNGQEMRRLVVNIPPVESDLAALRAADFQQRIVRVQTPAKAAPDAILFGSKSGQRAFWGVLLLATLALLFIEPIVANRTSP